MDLRDTKILLQNAGYEIRDLRRRLEIADAKLEMVDLFKTVLMTRPAGSTMGMSPDILHEMEGHIKELEDCLAHGIDPIPPAPPAGSFAFVVTTQHDDEGSGL